MSQPGKIVISGEEDGQRVESRIFEDRIQRAVENGYLNIEVQAYGQHGIGGRLWNAGDNRVHITVSGAPGQRLGSMGFPNTFIETLGPTSDDVGWLNAGAHIVVRGDATNGAGNAMAQGKIYIAGDIGARGMTMTKHNPRFEPPELWVLGGVGDSFAEFMAGGRAVICGLGSHYRENILGDRPCVGMVGGEIFFRGGHHGFSESDARLVAITDAYWNWLTSNMQTFLDLVGRSDLFELLTSERDAWQLIKALKPHEKKFETRRSIHQFRDEIWDKELGEGGLLGDLTDIDRSQIPVITSGNLRRFKPSWENHKYLPPCQAHCPIGIPVQKRWDLIRKGNLDKAVDLALEYTPLPATVCGYLCPALCMQHCTRSEEYMPAVDISLLGKASKEAKPPQPLTQTGKRIAVIGGGPAGLSVAWQLWLMGHEPFVYDKNTQLGGKISSVIPQSRIPQDVVEHEIKRIREKVEHIELKNELTKKEFNKIKEKNDFVVIAVGAQTPQTLAIKGHERAITALDFLRNSKSQDMAVGQRVVIIGAGNVGCDVAGEAGRLGAEEISLIDIQEPASFGTERQAAEAAGAKFIWPVFTREITNEGVLLTSGELLGADTVVIAIGDKPDLGFLPEHIKTERGFIEVNDLYQTSDPQVFAIGDSVRLGLITDAIGAGREVSRVIDARIKGKDDTFDQIPVIDTARVKLEYYDPRPKKFSDIEQCALGCASCSGCRDCSLCEVLCPQQAITRKELTNSDYEYVVDDERCIGCGFCCDACPCGIWELRENEAFE